ncbi:MAG TPA: ABC transporter substrate-binding protein [Bradyrhizobium sp.]|nr:ABC transporter substrate-binding protein [Bradyrhizobium sp.]
MRRRDFLVGVCASAPFCLSAVQAQKAGEPVIGYLNGGSPFPATLEAFRRGLGEEGFAEGRNVTIEFRWAEGNYNRLPELAADLVKRNVAVIAAGGGDLAARAAKTATSTIPIVATSGDDPVITGLVSNLARPDGNLTGVSFFVVELHAKRFELLFELVPQVKVVALLINPLSPQTERVTQAMQRATDAKKVELRVFSAGAESEITSAFSQMQASGAGALIQMADPFFISQREQIVALATKYSIPTIYESRPFTQAGGLISYGPSLSSVYNQIGSYVGKILKGTKPGDLPIVQPTKFELVVKLISRPLRE